MAHEKFTVSLIMAFIYAIIVQGVISSDYIMLILSIPGAFAGVYCVSKPYQCFWILIILTFLIGIPVSYFPTMYNLRWGINLLSFLLGASVLLKLVMVRQSVRIRKNITLRLFLLFFIVVICGAIINGIPTEQLIISLKNNFQFFPVLIFLWAYPIEKDFVAKFYKVVLAIALIQPIVTIMQYFIVVPKLRHLMPTKTGTDIFDAVNGTLGTSLQGGGTGVLALFLCIVLCAILFAYKRKDISFVKFAILSGYLLLPLLINETKISPLFLLTGASVLLILDKETGISKKIFLIVITIIITSLMIWSVVKLSQKSNISFEELKENTLFYNLGTKGHGYYRLNRLTCLLFWFDNNPINSLDFFIGHGLDATQEGGTGLSLPGAVARRYPMYGTGLTTASSILWETGIVGFLILLSVFFSNFLACLKLSRSNKLSQSERSLAIIAASGTTLVIVNLFYNSAFRNSQPANFIFIILIGVSVALSIKNDMLSKKYQGDSSEAKNSNS